MQARNDTARFGIVAQFFHWAIFLVFVTQFTLAYSMLSMPDGDPKWALFDLHKSIGVTAVFLVFLRIWWRMRNPVPEMPTDVPRWQQKAARASHYLLYTLMVLMPVTAYVATFGGAFKVNYFWLFDFPNLVWWLDGAVPADWLGYRKPINAVGNAIHRYLSYGLYGVVSVHLSAALWHHFVRRDNVLRRMLPFVRAH